MNTDRPRSEKIIDLQTQVRKACAFEIQLHNPLNEVVVYDIQMEGEGLIGDLQFVVQPKSSATYEMLFSPLRVFRS